MSIVRVENAKVGMIVAEDIFSNYGGILVNAGDVLDRRTIDKLHLNGIKKFKIIEEVGSENVPIAKAISSVDAQALVQFTEVYKEKTEEVRGMFNQFVTIDNAPLATESLTDVTNDILHAIGDQKDVFRYIHRMKQADPSIYTHSINVSILCNLFGTVLDFPEDKKNELTLAGLLHDIGKVELEIDVSKNILNIDQMDEPVLENYMKHSILSYRILTEKNLPKSVCMAALMHHESENGTGFPTSAKWTQIHEFAKIIAIANYYDHMTYSGTMQKKINPFAVIKLLEDVQFSRFDIQFVAAFIKRTANFYLNEWVELTSGEMGQIVFINQNDLSHPIIKIDNVLVDLSRESDIDILRVL